MSSLDPRSAAGTATPLPIRELPALVGDFTESTLAWIDQNASYPDIIHSHYWLSGWAGVLLKEKLHVPLANSFHTLGRVKDLTRHPEDAPEGAIRTLTEEEVIARSDPDKGDAIVRRWLGDAGRYGKV